MARELQLLPPDAPAANTVDTANASTNDTNNTDNTIDTANSDMPHPQSSNKSPKIWVCQM